MSDFISTLASKAGLDTGTAEKGLGALLSTLQQHIPGDAFSQVSSAIPNAGGILSTFQKAAAPAQDSPLGGLMGMAGTLFGSSSPAASTLMTQFSKAGFSMDTVKTFLPVALQLLKDKLSPETMKLVEGAVPGISSLLGNTDIASGVLGKLKNMF